MVAGVYTNTCNLGQHPVLVVRHSVFLSGAFRRRLTVGVANGEKKRKKKKAWTRIFGTGVKLSSNHIRLARGMAC